MNGYELVRKQPQQDSEISKRLPLTGGTVTGLTSFTKGIQSGTSVNWNILETGIATFKGAKILLPQGGNTQRECDYIRLGEMFMAGLSSIHFVTTGGDRGVVYAGNFNMSYRSSISRSAKKINSVFDILDSIDVIEDEDSFKLIQNNRTKNINNYNKCITTLTDEKLYEDEISVNILNTLSVLWKANQELIEENNKLNERLSKIENKLDKILEGK